MSADEHLAGPDEVTKPVNVADFREKLQQEQRSLIKDAKRALLNAALSLSRAGDCVQNANSQISEVLRALDKIII